MAERAASYDPAETYDLFEFLLLEARCNGCGGDCPLGAMALWMLGGAVILAKMGFSFVDLRGR